MITIVCAVISMIFAIINALFAIKDKESPVGWFSTFVWALIALLAHV